MVIDAAEVAAAEIAAVVAVVVAAAGASWEDLASDCALDSAGGSLAC